MSDDLDVTAGLPERAYSAGDVVIEEGTRTGALWVLVSGSVTVRRGDETINTIDRPGVTFGEISLLLDQPHGASVIAATDAVLRVATDGRAALDGPLARITATGLARRLDALTVYLADVKKQYGAAPGIAMVDAVLRQISESPGDDVRPVSAREPDPEF
jgi:CRP-like cAMP-binding protein